MRFPGESVRMIVWLNKLKPTENKNLQFLSISTMGSGYESVLRFGSSIR
jgi:hypothetical protein